MIVKKTKDSMGASGNKNIFISSLLVLGNVLGVGVLALPIAAGLGGFIPAVIGIFCVWLIMLFSAWLIVYRYEGSQHHDMPSFYKRELGTFAKWLAIACNLIILYGVLVAYVSGISTMISSLFTILIPYKYVVMFIYFCIGVNLVAFGINILKKSLLFVISVIWISFFIMITASFRHFHGSYLTYYSWGYFSVCLPLAVSAFHFHNIIPTVSKSLNFDKKAACKAIFVGVTMGLIVNLIWITVALATIPETGKGIDTIVFANVHGLTANVPLSHILHNKIFTVFGLIFGIFAVTSSFMTNGAGLWGYIDDLLFTYFKMNNPILVTAVSFLPVIIVAFVYPAIFLTALSIVGGIGEDILFGILPSIIILKISKSYPKYNKLLKVVGIYMLAVSSFILIYVVFKKIALFF